MKHDGMEVPFHIQSNTLSGHEKGHWQVDEKPSATADVPVLLTLDLGGGLVQPAVAVHQYLNVSQGKAWATGITVNCRIVHSPWIAKNQWNLEFIGTCQ